MEPAPPEPPRGPTSAFVAAGEEETRVLFRGLLRLHHLRVLGEADGARPLLDLIREHQPDLVVADSVLAQGTIGEIIREGRKVRPGLRVVVVTPSTRPAATVEEASSADVVLVRPFRIRQFAEAVNPIPAG
jgi:DNA-binding NarL/FixJ family response regulator